MNLKAWKLIISFLLFALLQIVYSQSGWFWQNPYPQGNNLKSLSIINENNVITVGDGATVVITTNGGNNWIVKNNIENIFSNIKDVFFVNSSMGWICTDNKILKTTNGGSNWVVKFTGNLTSFNAIQFLNSDTGFCIGYKIYKTTDEGNSWIEISILPNGFPFASMFFTDSQTGYISGYVYNSFFGDLYVYKTISGGINWDQIYFYNYSGSGLTLNDIYFYDNQTGWIIGNNRLLKTINGGLNWLNQQSQGNSIYFVNNETGWNISTGFPVRKTTNSGNDWFNVGGYFAPGYKIKFYNVNTGYVVSAYGQIYKTVDGGNSWTHSTDLISYGVNQDIFFTNFDTGFCLADDGKILKTTNSGRSWIINNVIPNYLSSVYFINELTGWLGTSFGSPDIYKTTDGGLSWVGQYDTSNIQVDAIHFVNINTGFASGGSNKLLYTTNSGLNWVNLYIGCSYIYDFYSFDSQNILLAGNGNSGNAVFKSTNGGLNWNVCNFPGSIVYSVDFVNVNTGFAGSNFGRLYKTTDGGNNWIQFNILHSHSLNAVDFVNNKGIIIGSDGKIFFTSDAGNSWDTTLYSAYVLKSIFSFNDTMAWIAGANGAILHTRDLGHEIIGVSQINENVPFNFSLHQNYPNPFNPTTKIKFDIPLSRGVDGGAGRGVLVKLIIYDLLGREVATLVNEQLKPGTYEVEWDGSNYASGVYFYSLVTNEFAQTKKLIFLK